MNVYASRGGTEVLKLLNYKSVGHVSRTVYTAIVAFTFPAAKAGVGWTGILRSGHAPHQTTTTGIRHNNYSYNYFQ